MLFKFKLKLCLLFATSAISISSGVQKREAPCTSCLVAHNVPFADSTSANWTYLSTGYNLRLQYQPALITLPQTTQQIMDSVLCAAKDGLKVQPRGGGHSYGSFSIGGQNGSLIVDMENFNNVTVDQDTYIAMVGGGVRLGNMAEALYTQGKRALPHGVCPGVGIGGHATHGGFGYTSRMWGLTLDTIVGLDVVLANGSLIHSTSTQYPDIYYAMRGAGDSFGIVTTFYLQTFPAPSVLFFEANVSSTLQQDVSVITKAFQNLQNFVLKSDLLTPNITLGVGVNTSSVSIGGFCTECDLTSFNTTTFPEILSGWTITSQDVFPMGWIDALSLLAEDSALGGTTLAQPLFNYTFHDTFYAKSVVVKNSYPLTESSIQSFWQYFQDNQHLGHFWFNIYLFGGRDSSINTIESSASAYEERDALWVFDMEGDSPDGTFDEALIGLVDGLSDAITSPQPEGNFSGYINYVDPTLDATQAAHWYFGTATYNKLLRIKEEVDPDQVFWNPQSIGNAGVLT